MEEADKLPLKRVEVSLTKFNEVAIPHHLDLLRQHKANILKFEQTGEWSRVRSEQTRARRVAAQLRSLLAELQALRRRVRGEDLPRFDRLTRAARDSTLAAIVDYLETSPLSINRAAHAAHVAGSAASTDSVGVVAHARDSGDLDVEGEGEPSARLQAQLDPHEAAAAEATLQEREAVLRGWSDLQREVHALHDTWQHVQAAALAQRDQVCTSAASVDAAAENVAAARSELAAAERLRASAWGAGGAVVGALCGGPVGLVVGAKAGAAALLLGSALGYLGARLLGRHRRRQLDQGDQSDHTEQTAAPGHLKGD